MPIKRLHYFNSQFLDATDFTDEQNYHVDMRRLHNRYLHTWGVADGFEVTFESGGSSVRVGAGTAIDGNGREVVLDADQTVELADHPANADVYVSIRYREQESDPTEETGAAGNTRWTEEPEIEHTESKPAATGARVLLAKVVRTGNKVASLDTTDRRAAGVVAGSIEVRELVLTDPGIAATSWVRARLASPKLSELAGSLRVTENLTVRGIASFGGDGAGLGMLTIEADAVPLVLRERGFAPIAGGLWRIVLDGGVLRFDVNYRAAGDFSGYGTPLTIKPDGAIGLGTTDPKRRFHMESGTELHVGSAAGGFSFSDRGSAFVENPGTTGQRWVLYSTGGIARLWSGGDKLLVQPDGRLQVTGTAILNNTFIGDVGHGAGWAGFCHSGAVSATSYSLIHINDGRWTLLNKRSGGGAIELRIDNVGRVGMNDEGALFVDLASLNPGNLTNALRFGAYGTGEGISSKRNAGGNQYGLDFWTAGGSRMQIRNGGGVYMAGQLGTMGRDPIAGLPAGWGGGLHTYDVYAEATVASGQPGGPARAYINAGGTVFGEFVGAGPPGGAARAYINSAGQVIGAVKSFVIDHPLDKKKALAHSAIEGPEHGVYYRGEGRCKAGEATVELPRYFEAATRKQGRTIHITPRLEGAAAFAALGATPIEDGKFTVRVAEGGPQGQRFYWEVKAVRADQPILEAEPAK